MADGSDDTPAYASIMLTNACLRLLFKRFDCRWLFYRLWPSIGSPLKETETGKSCTSQDGATDCTKSELNYRPTGDRTPRSSAHKSGHAASAALYTQFAVRGGKAGRETRGRLGWRHKRQFMRRIRERGRE